MLNQTAWWKYLVILVFVTAGIYFASPNIFGSDPGLQIRGARGVALQTNALSQVEAVLRSESIVAKALSSDSSNIRIHFATTEDQLQAKNALENTLGNEYSLALTLLPGAPEWLVNSGALPMYLGLDLRGGVHFLLQVDMDTAVEHHIQRTLEDIKLTLRENKIRYRTVSRDRDGNIRAIIRNPEQRLLAVEELRASYVDLDISADEAQDDLVTVSVSADQISEIKSSALQQNLTALRNRVDQLGVAEPIVQQQGEDRIVVQLPGVQDTARAKAILGRAATLETHLVDEKNNATAIDSGQSPADSRLYRFQDGRQILLNKRVLYSGDNIIDAAASLDTQTGSPIVTISLDSSATATNIKVTGENIDKRMAVVYLETVSENARDEEGNLVLDESGRPKRVSTKIEEVLTAPVIRSQLGKRFQIEGIDSVSEANDLALMLRSGALAAPVEIIEERTVGPSLGQANIDQGFRSVVTGFILVLLFVVAYYRLFGVASTVALSLNLVLIVSVLSLLQATLTLPGVAGIVLTVGMAVDANVLIFERIREELQNGNSPQASIHLGYDRALSTIVDANITTLIAAIVLFNFGTGPIKGFAVTLSIGIITSMFTAIMVTRMLINWFYGGKNVKQLAI